MLLSACNADRAEQAGGEERQDGNPLARHIPSDATIPEKAAIDHPAAVQPVALAAGFVKQQWEKADNRKECAPMVFTRDGGAPAKPRKAEFAGGWAVAFDLPDTRSAYGIAGTGLLDQDREPASDQHRRISEQWPYFTLLPELPYPSFAGYGLEGAKPYAESAPDGRGSNSLAYVRIDGQHCTYNVWSRLGRAHLEVLLQSIRPL